MRVGSASVRITPTCSIACKLAVTDLNVPVIPAGELGGRQARRDSAPLRIKGYTLAGIAAQPRLPGRDWRC